MKNKYNLYQEQDFHILKNSNHLFIIISNYKNLPIDPEIIYDGKENAVLYRNKETAILLDYINPIIRKDLLNAKSATIIEIKEIKNQITSALEYNARLKPVEKLPKILNFITPDKFIKMYKKTMDKSIA